VIEMRVQYTRIAYRFLSAEKEKQKLFLEVCGTREELEKLLKQIFLECSK
jgi:hypothetical protein